MSSRIEISCTLILGAIHTTPTGFPPDALARLRTRHPQLRVRLVAGLSAELAASVERGELDAALNTGPMERLGRDPAWTEVARESLAVIAPPGAHGRDDKALLATLRPKRPRSHFPGCRCPDADG